jgi:hypothetical protein
MDWEPIGTGRLPPLDWQAAISSSIGVDLPIPQKTHPSLGAMVAGLADGNLYAQRGTSETAVAISPLSDPLPEPWQHCGVVPGPSTADPALRGCSAGAAAQCARAAAAPGRRPAVP